VRENDVKNDVDNEEWTVKNDVDNDVENEEWTVKNGKVF